MTEREDLISTINSYKINSTSIDYTQYESPINVSDRDVWGENVVSNAKYKATIDGNECSLEQCFYPAKKA